MPNGPGLAIGAVASPWGTIHLAATPSGVVALEHLVSDDEFEGRLRRRFGVLWTASNEDPAQSMLRRAAGAIEAFVGGRLDALDDLPLDLADRPAWDRRVFEAVRQIPPGSTASYGEVARIAGAPGAARAIGGAVGRCPIGLAIPCHRVIAADGTLGGYGGGSWGGRAAGLELKRELLAREGVTIGARRDSGGGVRRGRA